jgi:GNAT superfamily N-acetyltransferase
VTAPTLRDQATGSGDVCKAILSTLPTWFGIPEANADYIAMAEMTPCIVASIGERDVGITTITRHFPESAEVHLMAIVPEHHRQGIGRAMLEHAEASLADDGVRFLQVKTLSPRRDDAGYEKTRAFYLAYGFVPLEEFPELWDPSNPALQLIKTVELR